MVRAFALYWGGIRFESLSTHHCWSLSKSFIPSLVVWSMTKNNAFAEESETKRATVSSQAFVTLSKSQLQVYHYLTTWLQIWYHSLLWGDSIRKGADLEKQNCLFGVHPAVMGKLTSLLRKEPTIVMASRQCFLGVGKNVRLLMQSCCFFCFFFSRPFNENFKFLKNCPYDFYEILHS